MANNKNGILSTDYSNNPIRQLVSGNTSLNSMMVVNTMTTDGKLTMKRKNKRVTGVNHQDNSSSDEEENN